MYLSCLKVVKRRRQLVARTLKSRQRKTLDLRGGLCDVGRGARRDYMPHFLRRSRSLWCIVSKHRSAETRGGRGFAGASGVGLGKCICHILQMCVTRDTVNCLLERRQTSAHCISFAWSKVSLISISIIRYLSRRRWPQGSISHLYMLEARMITGCSKHFRW